MGYTGFRFPMAHFPTREANSAELFNMIWDVISSLKTWDFIVDYVCMDGANSNRTLTKLHFLPPSNALSHNFAAINPYNSESVLLCCKILLMCLKKYVTVCLKVDLISPFAEFNLMVFLFCGTILSVPTSGTKVIFYLFIRNLPMSIFSLTNKQRCAITWPNKF